MPTILELRNQFRRTAGLNFFRATLGDENGVIDEPGRPGYVRIRYTQASGLGKATTVRFRAVVQKVVGMPVEVGYDTDGELAVLRADFTAQLATGINPFGNNPSDPNVGYYINQSQITTLLSHPVSSAADSMLVTVEPFLYVLDGTLHYFLGGDGDGATPVDLTASIPGTASKQCAACLFLDVTTDTIEIQTSTPIDIADDLTIADIQECITASTAGSLPVHAWRLYNGQTGINPTDITAGGDNFLDLRQLINVITDNAAGGMTSFNAAGDTGTPQAITDGNTLTIAGGTGLSSVAGATDTVTINLDNTAVSPAAYSNNPSFTVDQQGRLTAAASGNVLTAAYLADFFKRAVFYASTANISISSAPAAIDTAAMVSGQRILLKNQTDPIENGLWIFNGTGNALTRPTDFATGSTVFATQDVWVYCKSGTQNSFRFFYLFTSTAITIDTDGQTWSGVALSAQGSLRLTGGSTTYITFDLTGASGSQVIAVPATANDDLVLRTHAQTLTQKTLTTPTIGDLTNATHTHQSNAGGGTLDAAAIAAGTLALARGGTGVSAASNTVLFDTIDPLTTKGDLIVHNGTNSVRVGTGANGLVLVADSAQTNGLKWGYQGVKFAVIEEQQTSGTAGGTSTATTWTTRVLNTEVADADGIVTISANLFTPIAGTYRVYAWSPFVAPGTGSAASRCRILNNTAAAEVIRSSNFVALTNGGDVAELVYIFTANGTDAYALQYYVSAGRATTGLGVAVSEASNVERYGRVMLELIG